MDAASFIDTLPLTSYEKAVTLVLSSVESATATMLVRQARIPQGRIYSVLNSLREKGIVEIIPSSPKRYLIRDFHAVMHQYLEQRKTAIELQQATIPKIEYRQAAAKPASTIAYTGREEHLHALNVLKNSACKEIMQIAPLFVGSFANRLSMQRALERGVKMRIIILGVTPQNRAMVKHSLMCGAQVRIMKTNDPLSLFIRDGEEMLFGVQDYRKGEERLTIRTSNNALLAALTGHFEREWRKAKPLPSRPNTSPAP
jgi:HTH-type transcriptional regulator, sugar sensing transcriptional regulator